MASSDRPSSPQSPFTHLDTVSKAAKDLVLEFARDDRNLARCISDEDHRWMFDSLSGHQNVLTQEQVSPFLEKFLDHAIVDGDELRYNGALLLSVKDYPAALLSLSLSDTQRIFVVAAKERYAGLPEDLVRRWYDLRKALEADFEVEQANDDRQSASSSALSESLLVKSTSRSSTPQPLPEFIPPSQSPSSQPAHLGEMISDSSITSNSRSLLSEISSDTASNSWFGSDPKLADAITPSSPSLLPASAHEPGPSTEYSPFLASGTSELRPSSNLSSSGTGAAAEVLLVDGDEEHILSAMSQPASPVLLFPTPVHPPSLPSLEDQDFIPPSPTTKTRISSNALEKERVGGRRLGAAGQHDGLGARTDASSLNYRSPYCGPWVTDAFGRDTRKTERYTREGSARRRLKLCGTATDGYRAGCSWTQKGARRGARRGA